MRSLFVRALFDFTRLGVVALVAGRAHGEGLARKYALLVNCFKQLALTHAIVQKSAGLAVLRQGKKLLLVVNVVDHKLGMGGTIIVQKELKLLI